MEGRVRGGQKQQQQQKKKGAGSRPAESYLYSKVLPRHLRTRTPTPTPAPQASSPAGSSPACAGQPSRPEFASSHTVPQQALLNRTGSVPSKSHRSASSVTLCRRPSTPSVCKQTLTTSSSSSSLSVTAQLKQSDGSGGADSWQRSPGRGESPAEGPGEAGTACSSQKGQGTHPHGQATAGFPLCTTSARGTPPKDAPREFSLTVQGSLVGKEGAGMESREEEGEDGGYCALQRNSTTGDLQPGGHQTWTADRRRHKEEWCPFNLKERRRQYSEGNISPTGGIWRDARGHGPGSAGLAPSPQHPRKGSAPVSVPDTREGQRGGNHLSTSMPADPVFQHAGRTMTLEEACQLVFPSTAPCPGQPCSSFENVNGGTDTALDHRGGDRRGRSQTVTEPVSESVAGLGHTAHSTLKSAGEKGGTTQTGVLPSTSSGTNPVASSALSTKGTEGRSTPEGADTEENSQKHQAEDSSAGHTTGSVPPPPHQHTAPDSVSSSHGKSYDTSRDTSGVQAEASAVSEELQAVSLLQACAACQSACRDVRVLQCFHLLCPRCIKAGEDADSLQCGLCGAQQTSPQTGLPLLRDLFPGLFNMLSALPDPLTLTPPAQGLEDPVGTGETAQAGNLRAQGDVETERTPTALTSATAGSVSGTSHQASLDSSGRLTPTLPQGKEREQPPSATGTPQDSRGKQAGRTDSSDNNDTGNDSTPTLSDSSDDTRSQHATHTRHHNNSSNNNNPPTPSKDAVGRTPGSTDPTAATPLPPLSRLCGACHVQADLQHACVTCGGIGLCSGCHVAHLTLPVTRSHEVVRMSLSQAGLSPLTLLGHQHPLCPQHGQDLAVQCRTCCQLLCHRCLNPRHAHHALQDLAQLQQAAHKQFTVLKRGIKQHLLTARSSARAVTQQLEQVTATRQQVRQAIHDLARERLQRLTLHTQQLTRGVEARTRGALQRLTAAQRDLSHVRERGERLGGLLNAVTGDTPRLTQLILQTTCQAWFDQLRQQRSLQVEEVAGVAFRPDLTLEDHLDAPPTLGRVCTLATTIPDTSLRIRAVLQTTGEISSLAFTPYKEVACVFSHAGTCQVWNSHGAMLLDVSPQVTEPSQVKVTPSGILVILGTDLSHPGRKACVTFLSPSGSLLAKVILTSPLQHTHMDCPTHSRLLVSDAEKKTLSLYGLNLHAENPTLTLLRQVCHPALVHPRHVTITVAGDWLVNDQGYFVKVVSPEDHVTTVLTEDEPEAILQPPRSTRPRCCKRMLSGVCCDARGYVMSVDSGKNGLYLVTSGSQGGAERHFVSLQELTSSCHVTAMAVDRDDEIVLGMSDGTVCFLTLGLEEGEEGAVPEDAPL